MKAILAVVVAAQQAVLAHSQTNSPTLFRTNEVITITNTQGKVLLNVRLISIKANAATYVPEDGLGGGTIKFQDLNEADKARFGFNPSMAADANNADRLKAARQQQQQRQAVLAAQTRARNLAILKTAEVVDGHVIQITKYGILVNRDCGISSQDALLIGINSASHVHQTVLVKDPPSQLSFAAGDPITLAAYPVGLHTYTTVGNSENTVHAYTCSKFTAFAEGNPVPSPQKYYNPTHTLGPDVFELPK